MNVVSQSSPLDFVAAAAPNAPKWGSREGFLSAVVMGAAFWVLEVLHVVGSSLESE